MIAVNQDNDILTLTFVSKSFQSVYQQLSTYKGNNKTQWMLFELKGEAFNKVTPFCKKER